MYESGTAKRSGGPIYLFFTTFAVFTNSTPASLVLMVKQNSATEVYFSLSYKTLKQTEDKTKVRSNELIL